MKPIKIPGHGKPQCWQRFSMPFRAGAPWAIAMGGVTLAAIVLIYMIPSFWFLIAILLLAILLICILALCMFTAGIEALAKSDSSTGEKRHE